LTGEIQNVAEVMGGSASLTGQRLINGITTADTFRPRVNAPPQVILLTPLIPPGTNLSTARKMGGREQQAFSIDCSSMRCT